MASHQFTFGYKSTTQLYRSIAIEAGTITSSAVTQDLNGRCDAKGSAIVTLTTVQQEVIIRFCRLK